MMSEVRIWDSDNLPQIPPMFELKPWYLSTIFYHLLCWYFEKNLDWCFFKSKVVISIMVANRATFVLPKSLQHTATCLPLTQHFQHGPLFWQKKSQIDIQSFSDAITRNPELLLHSLILALALNFLPMTFYFISPSELWNL